MLESFSVTFPHLLIRYGELDRARCGTCSANQVLIVSADPGSSDPGSSVIEGARGPHVVGGSRDPAAGELRASRRTHSSMERRPEQVIR
ncbi:hypothetical protein ASG06_16520 [Rathayibacter sp. Leaf185]|nr:hypothetical protein ASF42_16520 [Rathayibacter sp. Leaf294]KQS10311.1 hypothetical protein ASG06_16520 [Rathayibacter sp. Leaf185]